jgi:hypothetical protein
MPLPDPDARWSAALDPLDPTLRPQLEALLQAVRQHPSPASPPCWLLVPPTQLSALRQILAQACLQAGLPWLWLPVVPVEPVAQPEVALLLEEGERCSPEVTAATSDWAPGRSSSSWCSPTPTRPWWGQRSRRSCACSRDPVGCWCWSSRRRDPPARRADPMAAEESGEHRTMGLA